MGILLKMILFTFAFFINYVFFYLAMGMAIGGPVLGHQNYSYVLGPALCSYILELVFFVTVFREKNILRIALPLIVLILGLLLFFIHVAIGASI
jgi:hypothetical protein